MLNLSNSNLYFQIYGIYRRGGRVRAILTGAILDFCRYEHHVTLFLLEHQNSLNTDSYDIKNRHIKKLQGGAWESFCAAGLLVLCKLYGSCMCVLYPCAPVTKNVLIFEGCSDVSRI